MEDNPFATDVVLLQVPELGNSKSCGEENTGRKRDILEAVLSKPVDESALDFLVQKVQPSDRFLLLWDGGPSDNQLTLMSPSQCPRDGVQKPIDCSRGESL